jgi:hypothetical protein
LPFQLFLFAYAVLGPLHYLTEIAWLKKYNFFAQSKYDGLFLAIVGVILTVALFVPTLYTVFPSAVLLFFAFGMSLIFFLTSSLPVRFSSLVVLGIGAYIFSNQSTFIALFSILLPTIIHVYIFTGLFMLYGALKSKSMVGFINVGLLMILGALFFILPKLSTLLPSVYVIDSYMNSFASLNQLLGSMFGNVFMSTQDVFFTTYGVSIMQSVAFAYTYHYLNWFSKTKIIGWQESAKKYKYLIYGVWFIAISLYAYSYTYGFIFLYFLSVTHVLLEFPLNHMTIKTVLGLK